MENATINKAYGYTGRLDLWCRLASLDQFSKNPKKSPCLILISVSLIQWETSWENPWHVSWTGSPGLYTLPTLLCYLDKVQITCSVDWPLIRSSVLLPPHWHVHPERLINLLGGSPLSCLALPPECADEHLANDYGITLSLLAGCCISNAPSHAVRWQMLRARHCSGS